MTRDEYIAALSRFVTLDLVKAYKSDEPTTYVLEMFTNLEEKTRTQVISVRLVNDDADVLAFSVVGPCPQDLEMMSQLLGENRDGYYSRLALMPDGDLVQVYRYPLEELEVMEFLKALDEVSRYADIYESKYFQGTDEH